MSSNVMSQCVSQFVSQILSLYHKMSPDYAEGVFVEILGSQGDYCLRNLHFTSSDSSASIWHVSVMYMPCKCHKMSENYHVSSIQQVSRLLSKCQINRARKYRITFADFQIHTKTTVIYNDSSLQYKIQQTIWLPFAQHSHSRWNFSENKHPSHKHYRNQMSSW